jgi:hypothetical protein
MRKLFITLFVLTWVAGAWASPARVILLRHAEKPADDSEEHLSARGFQRAEALAFCLTTNVSLLSTSRPVALFAARPTRHGVRRPYETLQPLAKRLNLPIQTPYSREDHSQLVRSIMQNPQYDQKTVIICWVHEYLPELAQDFGIKPKHLQWKGSVYDRFWVITFEADRPKLSKVPQLLLPGDSGE